MGAKLTFDIASDSFNRLFEASYESWWMSLGQAAGDPSPEAEMSGGRLLRILICDAKQNKTETCPAWLGNNSVTTEEIPMTDANVTKIELVEVGEGFRFDPDEILEAAKGQKFERLAILGQNPDGTIWVSGSANAGETVILIELAKHQIIHGE